MTSRNVTGIDESRDREAERAEQAEQAIADLLSRVPPRPAPPAADEKAIRDAVYAEWNELTARRVRQRRITSFALAASVLLAVFATLNLLRPPVDDFSTRRLATVERQFGDVSMASIEGSDFAPIDTGSAAISGGRTVQTGASSGLALAWHDGGSLRLDEETRVVFESASQVYLEHGRVYFDSEAGPLSPATGNRNSALSIRTASGVVRHLGTQYMTEISAGELKVMVREGIVSIESVNVRAGAGRSVVVDGSGELTFGDTDGFGADWEWVARTAPAVVLDRRPAATALEWVGRESGYAIRYATPSAQAKAEAEKLRVPDAFSDKGAMRALELFMQTVDLEYRIVGGEIVISER